jgi:hypothetical protein
MYDLLLVIALGLNIFAPIFIGIRDRSNADWRSGNATDQTLLSNASSRELRDTSSTPRTPHADETAEALTR